MRAKRDFPLSVTSDKSELYGDVRMLLSLALGADDRAVMLSRSSSPAAFFLIALALAIASRNAAELFWDFVEWLSNPTGRSPRSASTLRDESSTGGGFELFAALFFDAVCFGDDTACSDGRTSTAARFFWLDLGLSDDGTVDL